jgi:tRNA dimethylallyltransferase
MLQKIKKLFSKKPKIIVVLGQTSTGKSDIAVEIAKKFNGEVISADSRQVYRGMDLGSGKITKEEMQGVPHHLLDVADPKEIFDVTQFQKLGTEAIQNILSRGKVPVVCGGTGFYIDALVYQTEFTSVKPNKELRDKLEKKSLAELQEILMNKISNAKFRIGGRNDNEIASQARNDDEKNNVLDSRFRKNDNNKEFLNSRFRKNDKEIASQARNDNYKNIDMKNPVRLIRAIEIINELGYIPKVKKKNNYRTLFIGMTLPKEGLDKRIYKRIIDRLEKGMLDEAKTLLENGVSHERLQSLGLEYRFMSKHLLGEISKDEMIEQLYRATVQFAKRQKTWFKRNKNIHWFNYFDGRKKLFELIDNFLK